MRIGVDGRKIPEAAQRGPLASLDHGKSFGMAGLFYRTVLDMSPTLDRGELRAIRRRADELGMYVETGLGKVNPYASPEAPELRLAGDGDIVLGFRRMMEACVDIGCTELWIATANYKTVYAGKWAYDRFRTDVTWPEQLRATQAFLLKLAPIARDLGVHLNMETHEEITTFELLRLIEAVGADVMGVVLDTLNPMQRGEHPVWAARRVAPFVRQTHIKDAYLTHVPGGVTVQARACGDGVIDFGEILAVLAAHNPTLNLSLECAGPRDASFVPRHTLLEVFDPDWLASHPDLTREEYAAFLAMVQAYGARIASGEVATWDAYVAAPFGYAESIATIRRSVAHLRRVCAERNLPLEAEA
ncbi:sugar phosphate isomerase/epimerase [Alsobacter sp. SYSU M60028]|uniref:Sugar phosphate isomerase/epimerase n=1 Tax=Alsobacter ponti TaxID=2962936 RepID=A0ABT1LF59_9HYPH|nr:sugar phosphate isomerase/epimerase family protein [Alsobacter ponti]MCP8940124.1 sugar phosphate isomerase/epimerase [Alsobacter ponti]